MNTLSRFIKDESAVSAIEYGLLASLIAVAIVLTVTSLGGSLDGIFTTISGDLK